MKISHRGQAGHISGRTPVLPLPGPEDFKSPWLLLFLASLVQLVNNSCGIILAQNVTGVWHSRSLVHPLHRHLIDFLKYCLNLYQSCSILKKRARKKLLTLASNKKQVGTKPYPQFNNHLNLLFCQMHLVLSPQINFNFLAITPWSI